MSNVNYSTPNVIDAEDLPPTYDEAIKVITNENANFFFTDLIVGGHAVADLRGSPQDAAHGVVIEAAHISS